MDSVKLYVILFASGCLLSMCMALECNWKTHYEYTGKCCEICPPGEFPMQHCKDSSKSVCKTCTKKSDHCFCNKTLCENDQCSKCSASPPCNQGDGLQRIGSYKFTYICQWNEVVTVPKSTVGGGPVLSEMLPTNKTHDERCDCQGPQPQQTSSLMQVYSVMVVCVAITGLICLAILIYLCIRRTRKHTMKKKYPSTSISLKVPLEEHVYKLSKEEMGEV